MTPGRRDNDRSEWYRREGEYYAQEYNDQPPPDPKKADHDAAMGCGFILTIIFAILTAIGFHQMEWPWAFGAIAGIVGGSIFTLMLIFFYNHLRN
jgi:hypothetical protein